MTAPLSKAMRRALSLLDLDDTQRTSVHGVAHGTAEALYARGLVVFERCWPEPDRVKISTEGRKIVRLAPGWHR